jgi:hypothetical protein
MSIKLAQHPPRHRLLSDHSVYVKALYPDAYHLRQLDATDKRRTRQVWMDDFIRSEVSLPSVRETTWLFVRSLVREDYRALFHAVIGCAPAADVVVWEEFKRPTRGRGINPAHSRALIEAQPLYCLIPAVDPVERSGLLIRLALYQTILEHFSRQPDPECVVFFADMQPIEFLLAHYFRARGVPTATLQHGLYVDYSGYETVNCVNYLHQPSEVFLAWGEQTAELIRKYHPGRKVELCGKPLVFEASTPGDVAVSRHISVLLDQKIFQEQNERMLRIALEFGAARSLGVTARFHPSLDKARILCEFPGLSEQLHFADAELVIGHTSSLLYEALELGCRVMRYRSDIPAIPLPQDMEFTCLDELESKSKLPQPPGLGKRFFCAVGETSLARYRAFFGALQDSLGSP